MLILPFVDLYTLTSTKYLENIVQGKGKRIQKTRVNIDGIKLLTFFSIFPPSDS